MEEDLIPKEPKKRKWIRVLIICLVIGVLITSGLIVYFYFNTPSSNSSSASNSNIPTVPITYNNFAEVLSSNPMVEAIPENSQILLSFYNFNSGSREIEKSFILKENGVVEGTLQSPEVTLLLHSKYLEGLTNKNFCSVITQANANGDLGFETSLSTTELAWKFKSLYAYRDCLGF